MECEKIQAQFSSLLEKEMNPSEEKEVLDHLASCSGCRKELEGFEKTMQWLHSVEEVEAPEGFLSEILKTKEEREKNVSVSEGDQEGWWRSLRSLKLPIQAVAMVTVLFIAFYLTQMMPTEKIAFLDLKEVEQTRAPQSEMRDEKSPVPPGKEEDKRIAEIPLEAGRLKDEQQAGERGPSETKPEEKPLLKRPGKPKETRVLSPKPEESPGEKILQRERVETVPPAGARPTMATEMAAKPMIPGKEGPPAVKTPQEIILRVTDREKTLSEVRKLVAHVQGEILKTEDNTLHASVPVGSFSEFKEGLTELSSQRKTDQIFYRKEPTETGGKAPAPKEGEMKEKARDSQAIIPGKEDRIPIRILILEE